MAKITVLIASLAACFIYNVLAVDSIPPRSFPSCGYVGGQIYCFGGDIASSFTGPPNMDQDIYSLNISGFIGQKSDIMSGQWNKIIPAVYFYIGPRRIPISTVSSDGKRFMIQGGYNINRHKFRNQTVFYDTSSNSWSTTTPFIDDNGVVKQNYHSTAVNLPNGTIGFYGGLNQLGNVSAPEISGTGNPRNFDSGNVTNVGFSPFATFAIELGIWSTFSPQSYTLTEFYPSHQTATFHPSTGKIYYLGGIYFTAGSTGVPTRVPFSWAAVFDTHSGDWLNETLHGDIPTDRLYHTANLLTNSQDIVLYGGSDDGIRASSSYCYTLNLETNTWTKNENVNVPSQLSGPRFSHSAVLVNSTLFILFGRGYTGDLSYSLLTIDVSDASNIIYTDTYTSNAAATTNATTDTTENSNKSGGLSAGAIGGISAGSIVAGLGIIAFVFFYLRRQKKAKQQDIHEDMSVDWDEIEDHYREVPSSKSKSPQLTESTEVIGDTSGRHNSPELIASSIKNNRDFSPSKKKIPDTVVDITKPSLSSESNYTTVKPDQE
ncbi:hypothetical protein EDC94DRAFT_655364 [Helicostylum pulchrum]|nr:hypothetical protein EDC94DRAFT_655364 [Helicostylum pulchrum]